MPTDRTDKRARNVLVDSDLTLWVNTRISSTTEVAGSRHFTGGYPPDIEFRHTDGLKAIEDCQKLQKYLDTQDKNQQKQTHR